MFEKIKESISEKTRLIKKAAFLAVIGYIFDKITKKEKKKYIEDVKYKVKEKEE